MHMDESNNREDLHGNVVRQSSLRPLDNLKSTLSGRSTPKGSPTFRMLHSSRTPRKESNSSLWKLHRIRGNHLVFWLVLIIVWTYIGFHVQSKWAHNDKSEAEFVGYKSQMGRAKKQEILVGNPDPLEANATSSGAEPRLQEDKRDWGSKKFGVSLMMDRRRVSSLPNGSTWKKRLATGHKLRRKTRVKPKGVVADNRPDDVDDGIPRRNTSYGLLVGPFGKTEDSILEWNPERRKGTCESKSDFARIAWSRSFVLIFHELSMTGAPLSMMELATELLSCGGSVTVVVLSRKGGLMGELDRRGIRVLKNNGELSYKTAMKADLVIAGSAVCSSWIEQYVSHFTAGSSKIVWWIMENRRAYFDRSKRMLNQVKMLTFLSDTQSKQWLLWCEEEHIQLKSHPVIVPLSVNDELAFVAGIPCSLNSPSFTIRKMQEKRKLLRDAVRREMGLADSDMLAMSLSSINPGKGQLMLLESALLVPQQGLPLLDLKISDLVEERNLSGMILQSHIGMSESQPGSVLSQNLNSTNNLAARFPRSKSVTSKNPKKKGSRLAELFLQAKSTKTVQLEVHGLRKLLSDTASRQEASLKVLVGSVGSKSNKLPYIKGILRFLSRHSDLSKSVLWTPVTTHLASLYAAADVYVINAQGLGETFGRVTIEAMAFGLPVLGTDAGGTREIVKDKVTGLLHPIGHEGTRVLAQNIRFLLSNPSAREQLGKNGRLEVQKMYLKQQMYEVLAKVLVKCITPK